MTSATVDLRECVVILGPGVHRQKLATPRIIYAIECGGLVKLGCTLDPKRRLHDIRVLVPFRMEMTWARMGSQIVERRIHSALGRYRHHGEWFSLPAGYTELLNELYDQLKTTARGATSPTQSPRAE